MFFRFNLLHLIRVDFNVSKNLFNLLLVGLNVIYNSINDGFDSEVVLYQLECAVCRQQSLLCKE